MKAIFEFDLPDELKEWEIACKAPLMHSALFAIRERLIQLINGDADRGEKDLRELIELASEGLDE